MCCESKRRRQVWNYLAGCLSQSTHSISGGSGCHLMIMEWIDEGQVGWRRTLAYLMRSAPRAGKRLNRSNPGSPPSLPPFSWYLLDDWQPETMQIIFLRYPHFLVQKRDWGDICCGEAALHRVLVDGNDPGNMCLAAEPQAYRDPFLLIKFKVVRQYSSPCFWGRNSIPGDYQVLGLFLAKVQSR